MWEVLIGNLPELITMLIGIAVIWKIGSKAIAIVKEVAEFLQALISALADQKITQEELDEIKKELKDIFDKWKEVTAEPEPEEPPTE